MYVTEEQLSLQTCLPTSLYTRALPSPHTHKGRKEKAELTFLVKSMSYNHSMEEIPSQIFWKDESSYLRQSNLAILFNSVMNFDIMGEWLKYFNYYTPSKRIVICLEKD